MLIGMSSTSVARSVPWSRLKARRKYWLALPSPERWVTMRPGTFSSRAPGRSRGCPCSCSRVTSPADAASMLLTPVATTVTVSRFAPLRSLSRARLSLESLSPVTPLSDAAALAKMANARTSPAMAIATIRLPQAKRTPYFHATRAPPSTPARSARMQRRRPAFAATRYAGRSRRLGELEPPRRLLNTGPNAITIEHSEGAHDENQATRIGRLERRTQRRQGQHHDRERRPASVSLRFCEPLRRPAWHEPRGAHRRRTRGLLHHGAIAHPGRGETRGRTDGHLRGG